MRLRCAPLPPPESIHPMPCCAPRPCCVPQAMPLPWHRVPPRLCAPYYAPCPIPCTPRLCPPHANECPPGHAPPLPCHGVPWQQPTPHRVVQRPGELQLHPGRKPQGKGSGRPGTLGTPRSPHPGRSCSIKSLAGCRCAGGGSPGTSIPPTPETGVAPAGTSLGLSHPLPPSGVIPGERGGVRGPDPGLSPDGSPAPKPHPGFGQRCGPAASRAEPGSQTSPHHHHLPGALGVSLHPSQHPHAGHPPTLAPPAPTLPHPIPSTSQPTPPYTPPPRTTHLLSANKFILLLRYTSQSRCVPPPPPHTPPSPGAGGSAAAGRLRHRAGRIRPGKKGSAAMPESSGGAAATRQERGPRRVGGHHRGVLRRTLPAVRGDRRSRTLPRAPGPGGVMGQSWGGALAGANAACSGRGAAGPCARPP